MEKPQNPVFRETVESFAVALILAFLFRAFVAEAFVIPTGSMAPTLMGAHKDIRCPECGCDYQAGASSEFDRLGKRTDRVVVGATCPLCRHTVPLDLKGNANHATFSGDRILVSKFAFLFREPRRWEVIVFKYPKEARQNYIKRLVGRPKENLDIHHGDIHVQPLDGSQPKEIARKPPNIIKAVSQPLYDSNHLSKSLVQAGVPSSFQPFTFDGDPSNSAWKVTQEKGEWKAVCDAATANEVAWVRYFHRIVDPRVWAHVKQNGKLPAEIDPWSGRLITDFTHYNSSLTAHASDVYVHESRTVRDPFGRNQEISVRTSKFQSSFKSGDPSLLDGNNFDQRANFENDGLHWVGDLATEFELDVQSNQGEITLDIIEFGIHHYCTIDIATGQAKLQLVRNGNVATAIEDGKKGFVQEATVKTPIRGAGKYRIRIANFDEQITLWVGGKPQEFSPSSKFSIDQVIPASQRGPKWAKEDPLDGAPIGLGISKAKVQVTRARVWRDLYYIAVHGHSLYNDFDFAKQTLTKTVPEEERWNYALRVNPERRLEKFISNDETLIALLRDTLYSTPRLWNETPWMAARRKVDFTLEADQYFPMGDNSAESFDARGWDINYVDERLLIGRAVMVFWPHFWNRPIPFTPNIPRMGLIR